MWAKEADRPPAQLALGSAPAGRVTYKEGKKVVNPFDVRDLFEKKRFHSFLS